METRGWDFRAVMPKYRWHNCLEVGNLSRISQVLKMLQEFDLPARWTSLIQDHFAEAVHNLAQMWPDEQSLEVSYRVIEGFDHEFAHDIVQHPELHFHASNQALRQFLMDAGHTTMYPFVRIVHLPVDQVRTVSQLRADDIGTMLAIDAVTTVSYTHLTLPTKRIV